ncbi:uncharacterized protein JCM15063_004659 [Sporobolomyces koalae]|uniref:uncharacterized protein n=1 Tax=Sporobolomyces koalae TaxID=500713 RepID=UPI0031760E67
MSYTALPTSSSRPSSPSRPTLSPRHSSTDFTAIPTSDALSEYEDDKEDDFASEASPAPWRSTRSDPRQKRLLVVTLMAAAVVFLSVVAFVAHDEQVTPTITRWVAGKLGPRKATLLVSQPPHGDNGTQFSYYAEPLTNPVTPKWNLDFDDKLTIESLPAVVPVATPSTIVFHCAHANLTYCASAYRVIFMGPTMHSPAHSASIPLDDRRVAVQFSIKDPGTYQIYAYPEHDECNPFQPELHDWKIRPYFKMAVTGTPALITVEGDFPRDGVRACTLEDDLAHGRWISRKHISPEHFEIDSPLYHWVQSHLDPEPTSLETITDYRKFNYVFANYHCKVQHRTFEQYANEIKAETFLFLGDSITRDQVCLNYGVADQTRGACFYEKWDAPYEKKDKNVPLLRTSDNDTTMIRFHWEPLGDPVDTGKYISALPQPPSHIYFELGLWLTEKDPSPAGYLAQIRPFLETLTRVAPNASIVTRTTASAVQPIACYDRKHIQRRTLEPVNQAFIEFMRQEYPGITLLDSYRVYDDRPDSSEDGRHWERVERDPKWSKPEEGAVTYAMTDIIFETWRLKAAAHGARSMRLL